MFKSYHSEELRFSASHRYFQPKWSEEQNAEEFGGCFNPHGHGHDYLLKVKIEIREGQPEHVQTAALQKALWGLHEKLDHRHVNFEVEDFLNYKKVPTTENLALYCEAFLKKVDSSLNITQLELFETPRLSVVHTI